MIKGPDTLGPHLAFDQDMELLHASIARFKETITPTLLQADESGAEVADLPGFLGGIQFRPEVLLLHVGLILHRDPAIAIGIYPKERKDDTDRIKYFDVDMVRLRYDPTDRNADFYSTLGTELFRHVRASQEYKLADTILEDEVIIEKSLATKTLLHTGPHQGIDLGAIFGGENNTGSDEVVGTAIARTILSNLLANGQVFWKTANHSSARPIPPDLMSYESIAAHTENDVRIYRPFGIEEYAGMAEGLFNRFMADNPDLKQEYQRLVDEHKATPSRSPYDDYEY